MAGPKRTKFDNESLDKIQEKLTTIIHIIDKVKNNASIREETRKENLNMSKLRRILDMTATIEANSTTTPLQVKSFKDMMYTPIELLYKDIFGYTDKEWMEQNFVIPDDAEESFRCIVRALTEREQTALQLYYFEELTLEEVGKKMNVCRSRAGQLVENAICKLRNPVRSDILRLGIHDYTYIATQKSQIEENARNEYLKKYEAETRLKYKITANFLDNDIITLHLSTRSYNCAKRSGCNTIKDLFVKTDEELKKMRNLGIKSAEEIKREITQYMYVQNLTLDDMIMLKEQLLGRKLKDGLWDEDPYK